MKIIGLIIAVILIIIFVTPVRTYVYNLYNKYKDEFKGEEGIIGSLSAHNSNLEKIQKTLKDKGFYQGSIDGIMGNNTRDAIKEFQKKNGLSPTGKIDRYTWSALNKEKGKIKEGADIKIDNINDNIKKRKIQDEIMGYRLKSKRRVKQIQSALIKAGFYEGQIDGKIGRQTKEAIIAFQKANNLDADGVVGPKTWEELSKYLQD